MIPLELEDSHFAESSSDEGKWYPYKQASCIHEALDDLQHQFDLGSIKVLSLRNTAATIDKKESPVWCRTVAVESEEKCFRNNGFLYITLYWQLHYK